MGKNDLTEMQLAMKFIEEVKKKINELNDDEAAIRLINTIRINLSKLEQELRNKDVSKHDGRRTVENPEDRICQDR